MALKKAVRRVVRDDYGRRRVIYIDAKTLKEITDLTGYDVLNQNSQVVEQVASIETPDIPSIFNTGDNNSTGENDPVSKSVISTAAKSTSKVAPSYSTPSTTTSVSPTTTTEVTTPSIGVAPGTGVAAGGQVGVSGTPSGGKGRAGAVGQPGVSGGFGPGTTGKGIASAETAAGKGGQGGLAALAEKSIAGIDNSGLAGKNRGQPADDSLMGIIAEEAGKMYGPGTVVAPSSGSYTAQQKADIAAGKMSPTGSSRHTSGKAVDFGVFGPDGKSIGPEGMSALAEALAGRGVTGIGHGKGYMDDDGTSRMHADMAQPNAPMGWGAGGKSANMDPGLKGRLNEAWSQGKFSGPATAPVPTPNPGPASPTSTPGVTENPMSETGESFGGGMVNDTINPMTPSQLAQTPDGPKRSPEEMAAMGKAIAGELSPQSLKGLAEGSKAAIDEMANIIATMENRAQSKSNKSGSMLGVLGGGSYNSMMGSKMGTTNDNFSKFGPSVMDTLADYYSGKIKAPNPAATHYYNPEIANPSWGSKMTGKAQVGDHAFGSLPNEFTPGPAFNDAMSRRGDSPSESGGFGGGSGLGYSGFGGTDSPAEGGPGPGMGQGSGSAFGGPANFGGFGQGQSQGMGQSGQGIGQGIGGYGGYGGPGEGVGGGPGMGAGQGYGGPGEGVGGGPGMGAGQGYGGPGEGVGGGPGMGAGQNGPSGSGMGQGQSQGQGQAGGSTGQGMGGQGGGYGGPGEGVGGGPGMGGGSQGYGGPGEGVGGGPGGPGGTNSGPTGTSGTGGMMS